jgi:hypothetical protein
MQWKMKDGCQLHENWGKKKGCSEEQPFLIPEI